MELSATKKVILITSGQPSLNPRLVKEADALANAGYIVTVFYAYWNDWGTAYDKQLLHNSKWNAVRVGGSPKDDRFTYLISRLIQKLSKLINQPRLASMALSRAGYFLMREVKKHEADLYIAHNLGALPAAVIAARKNRKPCGFDAEDFHRNETSNDPDNPDVILKTSVENQYIPQVDYITASSPQIGQMYHELFPALKPMVVLNVFNNTEVNQPEAKGRLKLFWFSQTIGPSRGLEDIITALSSLPKDDFELHLLGQRNISDKDFHDNLLSCNININIHEPIAPVEIVPFAANFDIGLALEPGFCINNDLALSNKLFTYMQAGLAVIASETTAQAGFMLQNQEIGHTYPIGNVNSLADILLDYRQNPGNLMSCKKASLKLAHEKYNWETESVKFLKLVEQIL